MTSKRHAFSLVEVNLAILLVSVGILSLFSLFPIGLQESELGLADMHETTFADSVLSGMEANALSITNWSIWSTPSDFYAAISSNIYLIDTSWSRTGVADAEPYPDPANLPSTQSNMIRTVRYHLTVTDAGSPIIKEVTLEATSGKYGDFIQLKRRYRTKFRYMGM